MGPPDQPSATTSTSALRKVVIHSDGGCHGNPGPGGWAAVVACDGRKFKLAGGDPATTNNRMELMAAIKALGALRESCEVSFHTDSQYVKNGVTAWMKNWKRNGWKTKAKEPVKNVDLWQALDAQVARHKVHWHWVKGHAGHAGNEQCDSLATAQIEKIKKSHTPAQLKALLREFEAQNSAPPAYDQLGIG